MKLLGEHNKKTAAIARLIRKSLKITPDKPLRFFHGETNSTREHNKTDYIWIDISALNKVIEVNKKENFVLVEPNVPMDKLVAETLKYGLIPRVVMEFPGITVGGGVNGAALESSSFKYGQFNDNCLLYEVILGDGSITVASKTKNKDLFYGISGSYGSLGLITLVKLQLIPAASFVQTKTYKCTSYKETVSFLKNEIKKGKIDFIEGIIFSPDHAAVITGRLVDEGKGPTQTFTKARDPWFYEHIKRLTTKNTFHEELVPLRDYLFRYNRGAFWVGEYAFGVIHLPNNKATKFLLNPLMNTRKLHDGMVALNIGQDYFVQDFYAPFEKAIDLLNYSEKQLQIYPIWLCPIKPTNTPQKLSPHYIKDTMLLDIGIWGQTDTYLANPISINKAVEAFLVKNNSRKMFYGHVYYAEDEFWKLYDKQWYETLRKKYKAEKAFPSVWHKVQVSNRYKKTKWKGALRLLKETFIERKHLNT